MPKKNLAARFLFFILCLLPFCSPLKVQAEGDSSKAILLSKFPFTLLSGGVIILQAQLADFDDTLNFILDTGSGGISLDSALVQHKKLPITPSEKYLRGIASLKKVLYIKDKTLRLQGLTIEHLDFHINDYEILTSVYGIRIDGIIGYSFLSRYIVKIDYDANIIEVWSQGKIKYPKRGMLLKPTINGIPVFGATINDNRRCDGNFYFDSGAGLCLLMSEDFERDSTILKKGKKIRVTQAEGLGGKKLMKVSTVKELKFGKYKFRKVPAHIFQDEYNVTAYPALGGLIGNDLLRRFNIVLNYAQNEIYLKPNSHFADLFDYSYTGLSIYLVDSAVVIEDVLAGSPGEKAGLKPGDVIIAIDNNLAGNIQSYKAQLLVTGARLKILVLRNGKPEAFILNVQSIL